MRKSILGVAMTGALLGQGVAQAEPYIYMGLGLGQSSVDGISGSDVDALAAADGLTTSTSVDDGDTAWKIFGGYRLAENLAVEMAYLGYGTLNTASAVTVPVTTPPSASTINIDRDTNAWIIDAVGILPVAEGLDLFGKLGVAAWDVDGSVSVTGVGVAANTGTACVCNVDDDGSDFHFGAGASLATGDNVAIRAEWERISGDEDLDAWTLGMEFRFE